MLSVTIQPYSYRKMSSLKDLKSLAVLKFSHKGIIDDDFCFETVYDCSIDEVENKKDLLDILLKNIKSKNLITYNSRLLIQTLHVLAEYCNETIDDDVYATIPDLMVKFGKLHNNGRWAKLEDALQYYDHTLSVDTNDPYDMSEKTIILYRLMQDHNDI